MSSVRGYAAAALALACLGPRASAGDCDGDPSLHLSIDATTPIGGHGQICLEAPPGSLAFLMVSTEQGHVDTSYGPICVGFPLLYKFLVKIPTGKTCLDYDIPCDRQLVGLVLYEQFIVCDPIKSGSNLTSLEIVDGICDGDFCTYTQGGWGTSCSGGNPGCRRDAHFDEVFPGGLLLGDQDGSDGDGEFSLLLQSSAAVEAFLPAGGKPSALDADLVDPLSSSAGSFAGQLAAAKLNVGFDDAGFLDKGYAGVALGDLIFVSGVDSDLVGKTVRDVIALADLAISGHYADGKIDLDLDGNVDLTISDLSTALDVLNNNFDNCTQNLGHLGLPN